ncbi:unnamed protein product [Tenebrio molitor]|uniref:FLYWCH-type domain-containing protein n=1 Tax=Tenebrio molitor TaxID=7067 RepID=A0A8J6LGN3_TENMO|nr:hypothetical protein GEV33_010372 [Tenebrio molitor]CAH1374007.1 unnamed protein product [Tenebrio molitor]
MEMIETSKGKPAAIFNGFQYRRHRINKEGIQTWLCAKEKVEKCRGSMKTKNDVILIVTNHTCKSDVTAIELRKRLVKAKKRLLEEDAPLAKIYEEEIGSLVSGEFAWKVPGFSSVKSVFNRLRLKKRRAHKDKNLVVPAAENPSSSRQRESSLSRERTGHSVNIKEEFIEPEEIQLLDINEGYLPFEEKHESHSPQEDPLMSQDLVAIENEIYEQITNNDQLDRTNRNVINEIDSSFKPDLDEVDQMFLNYARRFRALSSKKQLILKNKVWQMMAQFELEEIEERKNISKTEDKK